MPAPGDSFQWKNIWQDNSDIINVPFFHMLFGVLSSFLSFSLPYLLSSPLVILWFWNLSLEVVMHQQFVHSQAVMQLCVYRCHYTLSWAIWDHFLQPVFLRPNSVLFLFSILVFKQDLIECFFNKIVCAFHVFHFLFGICTMTYWRTMRCLQHHNNSSVLIIFISFNPFHILFLGGPF